MATAAQVAQYRLANQELVRLAQRDLTDLWSVLDTSDPIRVRDIMLEFFPDLLTTYGDTAAVLGADWYDALRGDVVSARSFEAVLAAPVVSEQAQASARWGLGPLFQTDPDPVGALSRLMGSTQRLVIQPGRDSFAQSAASDPVRTAWARVPGGAETCRFCVMLASRGAVYADAAAAGEMNSFHDKCDCVQVLIRSADDYPEGHDVDRYRDLYAEGSGIGRDLPPE